MSIIKYSVRNYDLTKQKINTPPPHKYLSPLALALLCVISISSDQAIAEDLIYYGETKASGDPGITSSLRNEYSNIEIRITGVPDNYYSKTTEALSLDPNKKLIVKGENSSVTIINTAQSPKIDNNGGTYAKANSTIEFSNVDGVYIASIGGNESRNHSTALTATGNNANIEISGNKVQLIGSIDVKGGQNTAIKVQLSGRESFWYGSAIGEVENKSEVHISLSNGATWIINPHFSLSVSNLTFFGGDKSGGKRLSHLTLDQGIVLLADDLIWEKYNNTVITNNNIDYKLADYRDRDGVYSEVNILNLSGPGGIFKVDLDWQTNQGAKQYTEKSDFIKVGKAEDNSSQTVWFDISKAHLDEMKDGDKLYFASVESGDTTFSTNADGEVSSADEIYSFKYSSQSEESDNLTYWFLTKSQGGTNENIALLRNAALASYSLASDLDRFHERRDEARYEEAGAGGLWARYRYSDIDRDNTFDMDKNMIQVGYDKEVSTADSRKIVGIAFDYTHADTDLTGISGSGSNDRYALNLYYSVLADCGGYADFTAKIGRLGSDYDLRNQAGQKIGSSFWQTFYGVSAEFGWRYALNDTFFIEPQTQLQIIRIEGDQFETDGGIKAQIADTNSIIGRIGLRAGSTFTLGSAEQKSTAYVFADALREFKGDYAFSAAGHSTAGDFSYSGKETWYDAGIGTNVALSSNINFRLNAKYIFGGVFESSRQIDAAIHFAF
ncbi:autotransporter outer membrane beta-barrel domain-containing protein [Sutterella wadsworthensis]|uniref:autotransporter outer membrane beta-barrel domain-containing protein n=2 Tax=Sutterella wadsworthensis TaxID=40545 RepID=UPI00266570C4|nr:autotransporter outer membrane beta-barrel domain-containing protein [Sutterella wadsworthensis]